MFILPQEISAIFESMKEDVILFKFDLKFAYKFVRIQEGDKCKTAYNTKFDHFKNLVILFGLTNVSVVFQIFVNDIYSEDIVKNCQVYLDNNVVY